MRTCAIINVSDMLEGVQADLAAAAFGAQAPHLAERYSQVPRA